MDAEKGTSELGANMCRFRSQSRNKIILLRTMAVIHHEKPMHPYTLHLATYLKERIKT